MEKKTKVDNCASHTSHVICRVCGIEILNKNYERHLLLKHPSENRKNLKPKNVMDLNTWLSSSATKRKGDQSSAPPKRRNLSGDSGINESDGEPDTEVPDPDLEPGPGETPTSKGRDTTEARAGSAWSEDLEPGPGETPTSKGRDTTEAAAGSAWSEEADHAEASTNEDEEDDTKQAPRLDTAVQPEPEKPPTSKGIDTNWAGDEERGGESEEDVPRLERELSLGLTHAGDSIETQRGENTTETVSNSEILNAVVQGNLLQHQINIAIQRISASIQTMSVSPGPSKTSAVVDSAVVDSAVVASAVVDSSKKENGVPDFREVKSVKDLAKFGFTYSTENKVVSCDLCDIEFKYSGNDYEDNIQTREFMNIKGALKKHLKSQKHLTKETQAKREVEKNKQLLSRNQLAGLNLGRLVYANVKLRQSLKMFEEQVLILHLSGAEVGNINNSEIFVRKFRPELAEVVRQIKTKFLSTPLKATGFLPPGSFTADGATFKKRSRQFAGFTVPVPDSKELIQSIFLAADLLTDGKTGVLLTESILEM